LENKQNKARRQRKKNVLINSLHKNISLVNAIDLSQVKIARQLLLGRVLEAAAGEERSRIYRSEGGNQKKKIKYCCKVIIVKWKDLQLRSGVGSAHDVLNLSSLDGGCVDKDGSSESSKADKSGLLRGSLRERKGGASGNEYELVMKCASLLCSR
jgi:hypothetical protein